MNESLKKIREKFLPGENLAAIISNELKDFFITAEFRKEFFLMAGYSALLLIFILIAEQGRRFAAPNWKINLAFFLLAVYFIVSDFFKRKKILAHRQQFIIDSLVYAGLMLWIIVLTGGHDSPISFTLLFLTAISAPLYGTLIEAFIFITFVAIIFIALALFQHGIDFTDLYFHSLEGTVLIVATVSIKISLNAYQRKAAEYKELSVKQDILNKEIGQYSKKLEATVKTKTKELKQALSEAEQGEEELKKQEAAILNILEDVNEERSITMIEKEKLSRILQSIGDGVFVIDRDKKIIMFNRVAEEISGFLTGEVIGRRYDQSLKFVLEDGQPSQIIDRVFLTKRTLEMTNHTVLINKRGKGVPIADSAAPIMDKDGEIIGCIVVFRDVTREREIDRQKSEFVSVASHQLRTPLTSMKWFLEMILDGDAGKLTKEQEDLLKQVFESNERMIDLVNKLLNISRIESGRVKVSPVPTDINQLTDSVIKEMTPLIKAKKLRFEKRMAGLPQIKVDPKLIRQAFDNLLSNAIKYTGEGGKLGLTAEKRKKDILFTVRDEGMGIPKKQQNKIFNKFFRADNAVVKETEGTGMGLYVAKSIVELSGGEIWFKSEEGKGTSFFFTLPLKGSAGKEGEKGLI